MKPNFNKVDKVLCTEEASECEIFDRREIQSLR